MDPVTVVALAGNVIQFIDFGCNLLSESVNLYHSAAGTTTENIELEIIAKDIRDNIAPLRESAGSCLVPSNYQQLLQSCDNIALELLLVVENLRVKQGPHRKWRSFNKALRSIWRRDEISNLQRRLGLVREQIVLKLINELRYSLR
jgi:hypothetical protein